MSVSTPDLIAASGRAHSATEAARVDAEWVLRRNCCLTPRQLLASFALICVTSTLIGAMFWLHGAPLVLPFVGLEVLALGAALVVYARHAGDRERVLLRGAELTVESRCGAAVVRMAWQAPVVRVAQAGPDGLVELSAEGRRFAVGRYVSPRDRQRFATEFRDALRLA